MGDIALAIAFSMVPVSFYIRGKARVRFIELIWSLRPSSTKIKDEKPLKFHEVTAKNQGK